MEFEKLEGLLANHAAPTLMGIKPSNLISTDCERSEVARFAIYFNNKMNKKNVELRVLCGCRSRTLFLVYNRKRLEKAVNEPRARALMTAGGYSEGAGLNEKLERLSQRLGCGGDFPHEIGVFLGYPIEDIKGFIANGGEGFKLCGYWKVYNNEERARRIFISYDKCRSLLCQRISEGMDIYAALNHRAV